MGMFSAFTGRYQKACILVDNMDVGVLNDPMRQPYLDWFRKMSEEGKIWVKEGPPDSVKETLPNRDSDVAMGYWSNLWHDEVGQLFFDHDLIELQIGWQDTVPVAEMPDDVVESLTAVKKKTQRLLGK